MREETERVNETIDKVCAEYGIDRGGIKILAATKTVQPERINRLPELGITLAGENRVQEFRDKYDFVHGVTWHFIGALQTNKVKYVVGKVAMIHSLDRPALADEIDRLSEKLGIVTDALVEVNIGGEESKSGVSEDKLDELLGYCKDKKHLRVRGLMSVLPKDADEALYERLFDLYDRRKGGCFDTLSAGMSGDYLTAVKHGANLVRLGSIIFGKRN